MNRNDYYQIVFQLAHRGSTREEIAKFLNIPVAEVKAILGDESSPQQTAVPPKAPREPKPSKAKRDPSKFSWRHPSKTVEDARFPTRWAIKGTRYGYRQFKKSVRIRAARAIDEAIPFGRFINRRIRRKAYRKRSGIYTSPGGVSPRSGALPNDVAAALDRLTAALNKGLGDVRTSLDQSTQKIVVKLDQTSETVRRLIGDRDEDAIEAKRRSHAESSTSDFRTRVTRTARSLLQRLGLIGLGVGAVALLSQVEDAQADDIESEGPGVDPVSRDQSLSTDFSGETVVGKTITPNQVEHHEESRLAEKAASDPTELTFEAEKITFDADELVFKLKSGRGGALGGFTPGGGDFNGSGADSTWSGDPASGGPSSTPSGHSSVPSGIDLKKELDRLTKSLDDPNLSEGERASIRKRISELKSIRDNQSRLAAELMGAGLSKEEISQVLGQVQEESGFRPQSENMNYSAGRLMEVFPSKFSSLADAQAVAAQGPEAIGNRVYGGRMGNAANEGYKYRGRGFIQLTGKNNYRKMGEKLGIDLLGNPDLANDPEIAAMIAAQYYKDRKGQYDLSTPLGATLATGPVNARGKAGKRGSIAAGFLPHVDTLVNEGIELSKPTPSPAPSVATTTDDGPMNVTIGGETFDATGGVKLHKAPWGPDDKYPKPQPLDTAATTAPSPVSSEPETDEDPLQQKAPDQFHGLEMNQADAVPGLPRPDADTKLVGSSRTKSLLSGVNPRDVTGYMRDDSLSRAETMLGIPPAFEPVPIKPQGGDRAIPEITITPEDARRAKQKPVPPSVSTGKDINMSSIETSRSRPSRSTQTSKTAAVSLGEESSSETDQIDPPPTSKKDKFAQGFPGLDKSTQHVGLG